MLRISRTCSRNTIVINKVLYPELSSKTNFMSMLDQSINRKNRNNNNAGASLLFIAGSMLGGIGAYLFLTEKGALLRKKMSGRLTCASEGTEGRKALIEERLSAVHQAHADEQPDNSDGAGEGSKPTMKAQNMVSHLKHNKSIEEPE